MNSEDQATGRKVRLITDIASTALKTVHVYDLQDEQP
jgi:hypothetical protein